MYPLENTQKNPTTVYLRKLNQAVYWFNSTEWEQLRKMHSTQTWRAAKY